MYSQKNWQLASLGRDFSRLNNLNMFVFANICDFGFPGPPENRRPPQDTADHRRMLLKTAGLQTKHRRTIE